MKSHEYLTAILRFLGTVALLDLGIFMTAALISLVVVCCSLQQYGTILMSAGIVVMVVAGLATAVQPSAPDQLSAPRGGAYIWLTSEDRIENFRRYVKEKDKSFGCLMLLGVTAIIPITVGALLQSVVGPR